ncbi:MAG: ribonuclease P protein component [Acidimicrobiales bacterium]
MTTALGGDQRAPSRPQLWRVTNRAAFAALRRNGQRGRCGPLSVTWLAPAPGAPIEPPRVAFAIGRAAGGAVLRNRIRRRLRAGLRELQSAGRLPSGSYLLGANAKLARLPWTEVLATLEEALLAATSRSPR